METRGGISGGEVVAQETAEGTGRPYGVSSVHVCDDGSRVAVSTSRTTCFYSRVSPFPAVRHAFVSHVIENLGRRACKITLFYIQSSKLNPKPLCIWSVPKVSLRF